MNQLFQLRRYKNCFSEAVTPFVATNQHWKSFTHPIFELVSFCSGAIKRFDTPFIVRSITAPDISESRGRKFKSTWTRCTSSMVLTSGGEIPNVPFTADIKLNERSCTRYIRRSTAPNIGLDTCPKISELAASNSSKANPSRSFFINVIRAFRPAGRLVSSTSMFVPMTAKHAVAVISEIGQLRTSFLTIFLLVSITCNSNAATFERKTKLFDFNPSISLFDAMKENPKATNSTASPRTTAAQEIRFILSLVYSPGFGLANSSAKLWCSANPSPQHPATTAMMLKNSTSSQNHNQSGEEMVLKNETSMEFVYSLGGCYIAAGLMFLGVLAFLFFKRIIH